MIGIPKFASIVSTVRFAPLLYDELIRLKRPNVPTFGPTIWTRVSRGIERIVTCLVCGTTWRTMSTSLRWPETVVTEPNVAAGRPPGESEPITKMLMGPPDAAATSEAMGTFWIWS